MTLYSVPESAVPVSIHLILCSNFSFSKTIYFVQDANDVLGQLEIILRPHVVHCPCIFQFDRKLAALT